MILSKNWSPEEDRALLTLYQDRNFRKWTQISQLLHRQYGIKGKTPKKCRERFKNHLDPNINKEEWTPQEEQTLMTLQQRLGNKWAQISRFIPGRTDDSIKNKFFSKYRKAIRNINLMRCKSKNPKIKQLKVSFVYKLINFIDKSRKKITNPSHELLELAENLKKTIIQFQEISEEKQQNNSGVLSLLTVQVQEFINQLKSNSGRRRGRKVSNFNKNSQVCCQSPKIKTAQPQIKSFFNEATPKKQEKSLDLSMGVSRMHIFSPFPLNNRFDEDQFLKQDDYQKIFISRQEHSDEELDAWNLPAYGLGLQKQYLD